VRDSAALFAAEPRNFDTVLAPVLETIKKPAAFEIRRIQQYGADRFAGAPWTVACYMVEGGSSRDFIHVKSWRTVSRESFGN